MTNDVGLFYFGGSGGFFAFHLLLLSGHFNCSFGDEYDHLSHSEIFDLQWKSGIDGWKNSLTKEWKEYEIWPDPKKTRLLNGNRLFCWCGPTKEQYHSFNGTKILLYTDSETQLKLAARKKAGYFNNTEKNNIREQINRFSVTLYNDVKADHWPIYSGIEDYETLPNLIKQELSKSNFEDLVYGVEDEFIKRIIPEYSGICNNMLVTKKILELNPPRQEMFLLQDIILSKGDILYKHLNLDINDECENFVNFYLSLHTDDLKKLLTSKRYVT